MHAPKVGLDLDLAPQLVLHGGAEQLPLLQHLFSGYGGVGGGVNEMEST